MKKILFTIAIFVIASLHSVLFAQSEVRASVCVGDERLDNLLTEEQKNSVTHLTVTGTLQDDDYACLRTMLRKSLVELGLHEADIDTIPAHALEMEEDVVLKKIILPAKLRHLGDSSLLIRRFDNTLTLVLSGEYPTLGKNVFNYWHEYSNVYIEVSSDNKFCKEEDSGVYSADGTVFYHPNWRHDDWDYEYIKYTIHDGVKTISGGAFEGFSNNPESHLIIPATVDSIGDRTFALYHTPVPTGYWPYVSWPRIYCMSLVPPALGKDVFESIQNELLVIVPEESLALYKATEGWNQLKIRTENNLSGSAVEEINADSRIVLSDCGTHYRVSSSAGIKHAELYSVDGAVIMNESGFGTAMNIDKSLLVRPYTLLRISYEDGTKEMVKLNP